MDVAKWRRRFIQALRIYPLALLPLVGIVYLLGGFSGKADAPISEEAITIASYILIGGVPILAIIGFIIIGQAGDAEFKRNREHQENFSYSDAFEIPNEVMHGFKLALITGRIPMLTGLTGDTYSADASAQCTIDSDHIPPVMNCECGFYAYQNRQEAQFEQSINAGSYLLDVDLYGIGFVYQRGYRAETQVVNQLFAPTRCSRCKILPARFFVATFNLSQRDYSWWQWRVRCGICSSTFKESDKYSFAQMAQALKIKVGP